MSMANGIIALVVVFLASVLNNVSAHKVENAVYGMLDITYIRFGASVSQMVAFGIVLWEVLVYTGFDFGEVSTQVVGSLALVGGLACQNTLSNLAAGLQLIFTRPFEIGDTIVVAGVTGIVKNLDFLHTHLVTVGGEGVYIPNRSILGAPCTNPSDNYCHADEAPLRGLAVPFRISIDSDVERAEKALKKAATTMDRFIKELNEDKTVRNYANGTHTLAEYHRIKYGSELQADQKKRRCLALLGDQELGPAKGLKLTLITPCELVLVNTVKQEAFRVGWRCLREEEIQLH